MFAAQRIEKIKEIMLREKIVNVMALSAMLNVSDVTVRKDLDQLELAGFLRKAHGGAVLIERDEAADENPEIGNLIDKEKIAELAATTVEDGDTIFIGPGSLCYLFARRLKGRSSVTIVTNNVSAALELYRTNRNIFLVGGEIDQYEGIPYISGFKAVDYFREVFVSKAYVSVYGIDRHAGFAVQEQPLLAILRKATEMSRKTYILADDSHFDKVGLFQLCQLDAPHCVIASENIAPEYKQFFYERDVKLLTPYDV